MPIKKSELYSSLWASCDELRGGMDASQYKDYVLTLLFVKYISDKFARKPFSAIKVPEGASFNDMVDLVGTTNIGDDINKKILNPIKEANKLNDFPDFNDEGKLGKGKDLIDTVSNLILIFNSPELDFSGNSAEGDDILGDAYEYLMRHFATESGKSKGQFYTPAEVSRVLAKVIGINKSNSTSQTTAYDPTCGSGSLLLKVAEEAEKNIDLYGQEKEIATANLARMNMILHNNPSAEIIADNTLSRPGFLKDGYKPQTDLALAAETDSFYGDKLKTFDYVVANPPFSLKSWSNGVQTDNDEYGRFRGYGVPPEKNGDYAFMLHILKSMKSSAKAAVVLPHGVLFRGNAEAEIRKNIINKGYIKGIIGLPPNLFYGTGIPACIIVLDKENAEHRKGIFMLDASKGFLKDGNKNRLRDQDIRKITDVFNNFSEVPGYSRMVPLSEIADTKNEYNLNIPRYIDSQESEDIQDIFAHLHGGIPKADVDALEKYWNAYPSLKDHLFSTDANDYYQLNVAPSEIKQAIFEHPEFLAYNQLLQSTFDEWKTERQKHFLQLDKGIHPKQEIAETGALLLEAFAGNKLLDSYDLYQELMSYWADEMQDDFYTISLDGWEAGNTWHRQIIKGKKGKDGKGSKDKAVDGLEGIIGRMINPNLLIQTYLKADYDILAKFEQEVEELKSKIAESEDENNVEDGIFNELEKVNLSSVKKFLKQRKEERASKEEIVVIENYLDLNEAVTNIQNLIKLTRTRLEKGVIESYSKLTVDEIKDLVINEKWISALQQSLQNEQERISQNLTQRIKELAERYENTLPQLESELDGYESKVKSHLNTMGWSW